VKSRKPLTAIIIAVVIFLAFVITTRFYIRQQVDLVSVVAAADNIPPRTEIKPENLTVVDVPRGVVPDGAAPRVDIFAEEKYFTREIGLRVGAGKAHPFKGGMKGGFFVRCIAVF